ncbi:FCD domain-containing protein [Streptomyces sp. NPDC097727]|uniref:FCD domain-containing protein n=1 Tax=Streptomyces sp. NPDC097727 TaxID=3366092 RepID=UPI003800CA31
MENLFDMREALEVLAVRRAAERATDTQLRELASLSEAAHRATPSGRPERISRANTAFHHHIVELSGKELPATTQESLEGRLRRLFQQIDAPGPLREEHRLLSAAITAADGDAAVCALRHVRHYRDVALQLLFE